MREIDDLYAARDRLEDAQRRAGLCGAAGDAGGLAAAEFDAAVAETDLNSAETALGAAFLELLRHGVALAPHVAGRLVGAATGRAERDDEARDLRRTVAWLADRVAWLTDQCKGLALEVARLELKLEQAAGGDDGCAGQKPHGRGQSRGQERTAG